MIRDPQTFPEAFHQGKTPPREIPGHFHGYLNIHWILFFLGQPCLKGETFPCKVKKWIYGNPNPKDFKGADFKQNFELLQLTFSWGLLAFFVCFSYCSNAQRGNFIFPVIFIKVKFQSSLAQSSSQISDATWEALGTHLAPAARSEGSPGGLVSHLPPSW